MTTYLPFLTLLLIIFLGILVLYLAGRDHTLARENAKLRDEIREAKRDLVNKQVALNKCDAQLQKLIEEQEAKKAPAKKAPAKKPAAEKPTSITKTKG